MPPRRRAENLSARAGESTREFNCLKLRKAVKREVADILDRIRYIYLLGDGVGNISTAGIIRVCVIRYLGDSAAVNFRLDIKLLCEASVIFQYFDRVNREIFDLIVARYHRGNAHRRRKCRHNKHHCEKHTEKFSFFHVDTPLLYIIDLYISITEPRV